MSNNRNQHPKTREKIHHLYLVKILFTTYLTNKHNLINATTATGINSIPKCLICIFKTLIHKL